MKISSIFVAFLENMNFNKYDDNVTDLHKAYVTIMYRNDKLS